ncbi:MAG TPA: quinoprotein dehydrogenase-associated SoxYZ-like carrier [Burkholderiales bacterium]|nr:quinoprotein dehydrogenase-associated SoxYZ-like carrier [Burkholderiales bacterium]
MTKRLFGSILFVFAHTCLEGTLKSLIVSTRLVLVLSAILYAAFANPADAPPDPSKSEIWIKVRDLLFQGRAIDESANEIITLEAPVRAEDAATVPISIKAQIPQSSQKYVQTIYLIIDRNPSPIAAEFHLTPDSGRADIDTRVRIEEYSYVRAIAEMSDGKLYMAMRYVKASGGCSAPAGKDQEAALARLGKMKFRLDNEAQLNHPNLAQLMISHPNNSGLQMDQLTRLYIPARFVKKIDVTYNGTLILSADVDFSISENPSFRFYFTPREPGDLKAEVVDSNDLKFNSYIHVEPGVAGAGS